MSIALEKPAFRKLPIQKRSIEKVERILNCASKLLVDNKVKLTTRNIAKECGLSAGTIYQFFNNVESIMSALVERLMAELYEEMVNVIKVNPKFDLSGVSSKMIDRCVAYYYAHKDVVKIVLAAQNTEEFIRVNGEFNKQLSLLMVEYIMSNDKQITRLKAERIVDIVMLISDVMFLKVWSVEEDQTRENYAEDWRLIITHYINQAQATGT